MRGRRRPAATSGEQRRYSRSSQHEEGLERFRRDDQQAGSAVEDLALVGRGHVTMPAIRGGAGRCEELFQARVLVVDEGLQGADAQAAQAMAGFLPGFLGEERGDGQEGGLGLAAGGGGADQHVRSTIQDRSRRPLLDGTQGPPRLAPDPALDSGMEAGERGGGAATELRAGSRRARHSRFPPSPSRRPPARSPPDRRRARSPSFPADPARRHRGFVRAPTAG